MNRIRKTWGVFWISLIALSCAQERPPCLVPQDVWVRVGCYRWDQNAEGRGEQDSFLLHPLYGYVDSGAVFLLEPRTSKFSLLLSPHEDQTAVWLLGDSSRIGDPFHRDTIEFHYQRRLHFISDACGYTYYYQLTGVDYTRHQLDSVRIMEDQVTDNVNLEHVKIYF